MLLELIDFSVMTCFFQFLFAAILFFSLYEFQLKRILFFVNICVIGISLWRYYLFWIYLLQ